MRQHKANYKIIITMIILIAIGLMMIALVGPSYAKVKGEDTVYWVDQVKYLVITAVLLFFETRVNLVEIEKTKRPKGIWHILDAVAKRLPMILLFLGLSLNLLLAVAAGRSTLAYCQLGACRWLRLGPITIQVSDFLKLGVMLYLAKITADFQARGGFLEEAGRTTALGMLMQLLMDSYMRIKGRKEGNGVNLNNQASISGRTAFSGQVNFSGNNYGFSQGFNATGNLARKNEQGNKLMNGVAKILARGQASGWASAEILRKSYQFYAKFFGVLGVSLFLIVVSQKDLGSAVPLGVIALTILFVAGIKIWKIMILFAVILALGVGMILSSPHRRERLFTFTGKGDATTDYHIENALITVGSGGLLGVGIGNNVQTAGYLPESITDSMFAVVSEMWGFVGAVTVIGLYVHLFMEILKVANTSENLYFRLVTMGVFAWLFSQVAVNISAMIALIPLTGITLPLLSKGGTSLLITCFGLGLVINISRFTSRTEISDDERNEEIKNNLRMSRSSRLGGRR
ncbi:FtsW/RodA/SpoVE family cell cycle protein [Candidatus Saccharibacteria bacterium]|nr:FtsW/RodA/SpoVE family cell cycle protein [Candidatus Saccharibacteria bacterium]